MTSSLNSPHYLIAASCNDDTASITRFDTWEAAWQAAFKLVHPRDPHDVMIVTEAQFHAMIGSVQK